jgi:hypothetical protein
MSDVSSAPTPIAGVDPLAALPIPAAGDPQRTRLDAALLDTARALRAERERAVAPGAEILAMRVRADALLARAQAAAQAGNRYLAFDCVQQIECELVLAMTAEEREARAIELVQQSKVRLEPWRATAAERLADLAHGAPPTAALLQALLRNLHDAAQERRYQLLLAERQIPIIVAIAVVTTLLYLGWALVGGFDWLTNEDYDVTTAMWLVTGALFGLFGAVVSMLLGLFGTTRAALPDLRHLRLMTWARPVVGMALAIPIVLFLTAGVVNIGELNPSLVLSLCFAAGFAERWGVARLLRVAPANA